MHTAHDVFFFAPILDPKASAVGTEKTAMVAQIDRFDPDIQGRGYFALYERFKLIWAVKNLVIAVFVVFHIKSLYSTKIVE